MHADQLHAAFARLLVEPHRVVVVELEAVAGARRVGVAVPLPRIDLVQLQLALHLLDHRGLVDAVGRLVPVVVRREIALAQRALRAGHFVDLFLLLAHQPARQDCERRIALRAFRDLAVGRALDLARRHAGDHHHVGLGVEEHLLDEILEAVRLGVVLQVEAHVAGGLAVAEVQRDAVGEVRLHVDDEVLALRILLVDRRELPGLGIVDVEDLAVHAIRRGEAGGQAHRAGHERAAIDVELPRALLAHLADQLLDLLLALGLRPRQELLVRHDLRGHRRVDALLQVALDFANPHG